MKRRQFLKQTASVAGLSFVACGLVGLAALAMWRHNHMEVNVAR